MCPPRRRPSHAHRPKTDENRTLPHRADRRDLADQTIDLSEIEDAYDVDLDEETSSDIGDIEELSAAPDEIDPMGAPTI